MPQCKLCKRAKLFPFLPFLNLSPSNLGRLFLGFSKMRPRPHQALLSTFNRLTKSGKINSGTRRKTLKLNKSLSEGL